MTVETSYEALEAQSSLISGGDVALRALDDGVNAGSSMGFAGWRRGEMDSIQALPQLRITGGSLTIDADGDGLDSNGDLIVEGGMVIVNGPTNSGNGALDSGTESGGVCSVNGGTVLAVGAAGMAEAFDENSQQCAVYYRFDQPLEAGVQLQILAADGSALMTYVLEKRASSIVFSCPALVLGDTIQIIAGEINAAMTVGESASDGSFDGLGGGFGGGRGGFGGRRGGGRRLAP